MMILDFMVNDEYGPDNENYKKYLRYNKSSYI